MVEENKIDTNLYSRQIGTFGLETMAKLTKMKVLIVGMRGLGVETAKNLILAGPKQVSIYDPTTVAIADRGSNFFISDADVGARTRAEASVGQLRELNPHVITEVITEVSDEVLTQFNVVCITENFFGVPRLYEMNEACRAANVGFIISETLGLMTYAFLDYGDNFKVNDKDGEQTKQFIVVNVEQGENATVTVHEDKRHSFQDGDFVKFAEVEGMGELNEAGPIEIYDCRPFSFKLRLDTSGFGAYTRQGIVEDIKVPQHVPFKCLREAKTDPAACTAEGFLQPADMKFFGMGRTEQLHISMGACHLFYKEKGRYPADNAEDLAHTVVLAKAGNEKLKEKSSACAQEEVDEDIVKKVAAYSTCSITSMAALMGGFIAQEIVKFTGKYMPLRQWFHYDCFESLPDGEANREPMNCRYDDQIRIYGREVQEKLGNVKTFMIGAGALGCEYVKAMAMMGLCCGPEGSVTVTDNDTIEVSNLNRQFLFRKPDVGQSKSATACAKAKEMNPDLKVTTYQSFVSPDTEDLFNDEFWEGLDFIVNAVDNIKARLYVDSRCVWYCKPLLESGTLGTKANQQMIVPFKTQCYGDSQDPPEESIPMCTLRNFPNLIEHCIEWGRDAFNTLFTSRVQDAVEFVRDPAAFVASLRQNQTSSGVRAQLADIQSLVALKSASTDGIVSEARDIFDKFYDHNIRDLKALFPDDHKDSSGQPFWSGPKRSPQPVTFDAADPLHFSFVLTCANLIAANSGKDVLSEETVRDSLSRVQGKPYVKKVIVVETPEEAKAREEAGQPAPAQSNTDEDDDEPVITQLLEQLRVSTDGVTVESLSPADFEKDDDDNFHIDFINACSNLRARNYKITECDRNKTKMIAGKIIPAIATTTAMITGAVGNEIFKYAQGFNEIGKFKNAFVNLALPLFLFSEPDDVKLNKSKEFDPIVCGPIKMLPEGYTNYDKVEVNEGSLTLQQMLDWMKTNKGVDISLITIGTVLLYNAYLPGNKHAARLPKKVEDIYREITQKDLPAGRKYLAIEVGGVIIEDGADFQMPPVKYTFA